MRSDRVISGNGRRRGPVVLLLVGVLAAGLAVPAAADSSEPRFLTTWGTSGPGDGQFNQSRGVAVGPDGTVYVTDTFNHRIQFFDPTGAFQAQWGSSGSGDGQFSFPARVTVAPDGTVYVADTDNDRIQVFDPAGTFQGQWGGPPSGSGNAEFNAPRGVAVAPDGTVYVADTGNHRIQVFDPAGTFQGEWGTFGQGDGQFFNPWGIAVAPDGTVYVADTANHRIQVFDPAGTFQGEWGGPSSGPGDGQFNSPSGVAVGPDGTVYIADANNHRIQYFDPAGAFQGQWGSSGSGDGQFNFPFGVAVGLHGTVYVADTFNHRIQKFAFPSVTRAAGPNRFATAAAISELHHPTPQAVDTVFVATGANFPDALAGAVAAAATGSPLLLTASLPEATADELGRVNPDDIVILGGPAAVDAATETALEAFGTVTRIFGANRYTTAIEISKSLFGDGEADAVVVATGENFPDALAAASLATQVNGPVLLTPTASLPQVVADEIGRLGPSAIYIVGGPAAVSDAVATQLAALTTTEPIAGANRYLTAVEISKEAFPTGAGVVYVAVGTNFPDALAGAAQAAFWGAPILLTPSDALPQSVIDEIGRLDPYAIVILGGTAVISPAVEDQLRTLLAAPPPESPSLEALPETLETVQAAVEFLVLGTSDFDVAASCGGSVEVACSDGQPVSPAPQIRVVGSNVVATEPSPGTFEFAASLSVETLQAIPISTSGVNCDLTIDTSLGDSPTVQGAGSAVFSTHGGAMGPSNRIDFTDVTVSGIENADFSLSGHFLCASFGDLFTLGLITDLIGHMLSDLLPGLCGAAGDELFVVCP